MSSPLTRARALVAVTDGFTDAFTRLSTLRDSLGGRNTPVSWRHCADDLQETAKDDRDLDSEMKPSYDSNPVDSARSKVTGQAH